MSYNWCKLAGVVIAAVFGVSNAKADQVYFTASGTNTIGFYSWNIPGGIFGFVYEYYDLATTCPGTSCVSASTPGGTPLGNFQIAIGGNYYFSNVGNGTPGAELIPPSLYYETLVPFGGGSYGFSMGSGTGGGYLLHAQETGYTVYGTPGINSATIELDLTNATSQVIAGLPSTVYLDITGTTNIPMTLDDFSGNPSGKLFSGFTLDWNATLSDTSLLNSQGSSTAPEPSTAGMVTGAVAALSLFETVRRRRRRAL